MFSYCLWSHWYHLYTWRFTLMWTASKILWHISAYLKMQLTLLNWICWVLQFQVLRKNNYNQLLISFSFGLCVCISHTIVRQWRSITLLLHEPILRFFKDWTMFIVWLLRRSDVKGDPCTNVCPHLRLHSPAKVSGIIKQIFYYNIQCIYFFTSLKWNAHDETKIRYDWDKRIIFVAF